MINREELIADFEKDPRFIRNLMGWAEITGLCLSLKERYLKGESPSANPRKQLFLELRKIKEKRWITPPF